MTRETKRVSARWTYTVASLALLGGVALVVFPPSATAADEAINQRVTLNLKDIPLRSAVEAFFSGTGYQYSIDPNVMNVPVTLTIRDIGLESALRLVVRQAAVAQPGLTFTKDGDIFVVKVRNQAPSPVTTEEAPPEYTAAAAEFQWERIPIQFNNVAVFALAFGGKMLPTEAQLLGAGSGGNPGMGGGMGGMGGGGGLGNLQGNGYGSGYGSGSGYGTGTGYGSGYGGYGSGSGGTLGSGDPGRRF